YPGRRLTPASKNHPMTRHLGKVFLFGLVAALAGCATSTVDSRIAERRELFDSFALDVREKIAAGRVDLGFTPEMVAMALGEPSRTVERRSLNERTEVWYYTRSQPRISFGFGIGSGHY